MERLAGWIISRRRWIVAATALITLGLGWFIKDVRVDPDIFNYLPDDDPKAVLFNEIGKKYGGNYFGIIALETEDVFNTKTLANISRITDTLRNMEHIGAVTSLTNVIDIRGSEWGIEIGKLLNTRSLPDTPEELAALKDKALGDDMYRGTLVSDDATLTTVMVRIREGVDKLTIAGQIRDKIDGMNLEEKVYYGGMPFVFKNLGDIILNDIVFLAPLTALIIIVVLFLSFRSARGVVLPLLTVGISLAWTIGLMGLLKVPLSIVSDVIPVILLAVGSAYTIHVMNRAYVTGQAEDRGHLVSSLGYIIVPVFLAAITTMAGFISFILGSYLEMISTFGIFMAAGVAFSFLLSVTFAPALMAMFPPKKKPAGRTYVGENDILSRALNKIRILFMQHSRLILAVWGMVIIAAIAGVFLIHRNVDTIYYFKKGDPIYIAEKLFRNKFGGAMPVYVTIRGDVQDPAVLRALQRTSAYLEGTGKIVYAQSVADLIERMNDVMGEGMVIPDEKIKVEQLWFLLEGQEAMEQMVSPELDEALISATFNEGDAEIMQNFVNDLDRYLRENPCLDCSIQYTGLPSLYINIDRSILKSQFQSLVFAIILVLVMVSLILRSFPRGLLAIVPILATLAILFGTMGWAAIPLDIATVLVGSVSIGIGVDYAIHMITHVDHELKTTGDLTLAVTKAVTVSGRAIAINVLSVAFGFLVLVFSDLVPLQRFGALVALTMFASGMASLTIIPALMTVGKKAGGEQ
jgi:hypothetical protein